MSKSKILRRIAMVISLIMLITSTVNTTYGFIVTATDPLVNIFMPEDVKVSGLTLNKTVEHPLGESYKIPDHIRFDFKLELGSYYANAKLTTTAGEMTADANGTLDVTVKPGTAFEIEGLEEGTVIKVTEQATTLAGFAVKGEATKEITVGADGNASIAFINTYTPAKVQLSPVSVKGIKVLEGREWQEGDRFSFKLEQQEGDSWTELGTKTVTYQADNANFNRFDFSDIVQALTFDKVGSYTFRMTEVVGNLANLDYDTTVNTFTVKVTDVDMDGKLEVGDVSGAQNAVVTKDNGQYGVSVTFNNTFVPPVLPDPDDIAVTITVNKTVRNTGEVSIGPGGFEFVLENVANREKLALDSDTNGQVVFTLPFTAADIGKTYTYKLFETNEGVTGMTYDADVYTITVAISLDNENNLIATMTMNGDAVDALAADFENTYHANHVVPPTGDNNHIAFWFLAMVASGAAFVVLLLLDKKYARAES